MIRRAIGKASLRAFGWTIHGDPPDREHIGILLAAPHTATRDFTLFLATAWATDIRPKYLIKKEMVKGPLGAFFKVTGAIPTDRENPLGLVDDLVSRAGGEQAFTLVLAPEGTRKLAKGWKSGFYRIARGADIPVTPCSVDGTTKEVWFGPTFHLTGDVAADMDRLRDFYRDKGGVHPALKSPVRLSSEDDSG